MSGAGKVRGKGMTLLWVSEGYNFWKATSFSFVDKIMGNNLIFNLVHFLLKEVTAKS